MNDVERLQAEGYSLSDDVIAANRRVDAEKAALQGIGKDGKPKRKRLSTLRNPQGEDAMQIALMQWARMPDSLRLHPELSLLHHVPNSGASTKAQGAMMKRMGALAGVCDLFLPVARGGYHGMFGELKFGRNDMTDYQAKFQVAVIEQGYKVFVWWDDWNVAARNITEYLDGRWRLGPHNRPGVAEEAS